MAKKVSIAQKRWNDNIADFLTEKLMTISSKEQEFYGYLEEDCQAEQGTARYKKCKANYDKAHDKAFKKIVSIRY